MKIKLVQTLAALNLIIQESDSDDLETYFKDVNPTDYTKFLVISIGTYGGVGRGRSTDILCR